MADLDACEPRAGSANSMAMRPPRDALSIIARLAIDDVVSGGLRASEGFVKSILERDEAK